MVMLLSVGVTDTGGEVTLDDVDHPVDGRA